MWLLVGCFETAGQLNHAEAKPPAEVHQRGAAHASAAAFLVFKAP
jgi:hypothetical protein